MSNGRTIETKLRAFMDAHVYPNEAALEREVDEGGTRWKPLPLIESLKEKARAEGLWNLFLPGDRGAGLSNLEYAPLAEIMGRSLRASDGVPSRSHRAKSGLATAASTDEPTSTRLTP